MSGPSVVFEKSGSFEKLAFELPSFHLYVHLINKKNNKSFRAFVVNYPFWYTGPRIRKIADPKRLFFDLFEPSWSIYYLLYRNCYELIYTFRQAHSYRATG